MFRQALLLSKSLYSYRTSETYSLRLGKLEFSCKLHPSLSVLIGHEFDNKYFNHTQDLTKHVVLKSLHMFIWSEIQIFSDMIKLIFPYSE